MTTRVYLHRCTVLAALCGGAPSAFAQSYHFTLDSNASTSDLHASVGVDLPGTAIGNWEATTNPTGTQTRPGFFGGSGNNPVDMDSVLVGATEFAGHPGGSFVATIDVARGVAAISGVDVLLIGGASAATDFTLNLTYETFRTFAPNSLYIGGFTLPIPLGQVAVTNARVLQSGAAVPGLLTATATPDVYDFSALVPATLSFDVDVLGSPSSVGPVPFALPLVGTLDLSGGGAVFSLSATLSGNELIVNPDPQTIEDLALDLPTILPTGSIAHLLLDVTVGDTSFDFATSLDWIGNGVGTCETLRYCSRTPNTYSNGADIRSSGSASVALNDLTLGCDGVPPFHAGRFYFGSQQAFLPFGDGNLCLGGTRRRLKVVFADALGQADCAVDFLDPLQPATMLTAGSTWNFQFVYRDPLGGPLTFNTSDALQITFCP